MQEHGANHIRELLFNEDQQHLERCDCPEGMRLSGRHNDAFTRVHVINGAADGYFCLALKYRRHCVARGSVRADLGVLIMPICA